MLAPGVAAVLRPPDQVQVGVGDQALVVGADEARGLLDRLAHDGASWSPGRHDLLWRRLRERRLVVPAASVRADLAVAGGVDDDPARAAVAATYAVLGEAAPTALARRRSVVVGLAGRADWCTRVAALAAAAGLATRTAAPDPRRRRARAAGPPPQAWLLADLPEAADDLMRTTTPHLLLGSTPAGGVRVGPFTAPGESACLRCVSAARADRDPASPLVDLQLARARTTRRTSTAVPAPLDPALVTVALGLAVADVVRWADGRRPRTWSATVDVDDDLDLAPQRWPVHPRCGCDWAA